MQLILHLFYYLANIEVRLCLTKVMLYLFYHLVNIEVKYFYLLRFTVFFTLKLQIRLDFLKLKKNFN